MFGELLSLIHLISELSKKLVSRHFPYVAVLLGGIDGLMVYAEALLEGGVGEMAEGELTV